MLCLLLFSQPTQSDKAPCLGKELSTECQLPLSFPPLCRGGAAAPLARAGHRAKFLLRPPDVLALPFVHSMSF